MTATWSLGGSSSVQLDTLCPTGKVPIAGGAHSTTVSNGLIINGSWPLSNGWRVELTNRQTSIISLQTFALCVYVS